MNLIRLATAHDASPILGIYAPYIENTSYTFETDVPDLESFTERINLYLQNWPWLVCEINGMVGGYAYAARHRERIAYQWSVESSIYVHDDYQRAGIATALYTSLIEILKFQGFRNVYAVINLPNEKSVAFHEKMGFEYFGTFKKVGYKLGRWKDVGWWQLQVNEYSADPLPPIPFSKLDKEGVSNILASSSRLIKM